MKMLLNVPSAVLLLGDFSLVLALQAPKGQEVAVAAAAPVQAVAPAAGNI